MKNTGKNKHLLEKFFTLLELLTVIAVIVILASLLLPAFSRAKDAVKKTTCGNNQKQLSQAVMFYSDDYTGKFPYMSGINIAKSYHVNLGPYLGYGTYPADGFNVYRNPSDYSPRGVWNCPKTKSLYTEYAGNIHLIIRNFAQIRNPTKIFLFVDDKDGHFYIGGDTDEPAKGLPIQMNMSPGNNSHSLGNNVAFVDGHIKWSTGSECSKFRFSGGIIP